MLTYCSCNSFPPSLSNNLICLLVQSPFVLHWIYCLYPSYGFVHLGHFAKVLNLAFSTVAAMNIVVWQPVISTCIEYFLSGVHREMEKLVREFGRKSMYCAFYLARRNKANLFREGIRKEISAIFLWLSCSAKSVSTHGVLRSLFWCSMEFRGRFLFYLEIGICIENLFQSTGNFCVVQDA